MRRWAAFLRRDLRVAASYRADFFFAVAAGVMTLTLFYFLARTVGASPALAQEGDYFSFALVGVAMASGLRALQTSFAHRLRETQVDGSLEVIAASPISTLQVIAGLAAYPVLSSVAREVAILAVGAVFLGAHLAVNPLALAAALLASTVAFAALGLVSAAFVLVFKRGDPFAYALDAASYLLCGVLYPVHVLPPSLQAVARFLPATHALRAVRGAVLHGARVEDLGGPLGALALFSVVCWPLAALLLTAARRHAERAGTLGQS